MCGSIRNGYDSNPRSDPTFESAYRRYGDLFGATCANQCCINGLVVDSKKKAQAYQVVAVQPTNPEGKTAYNPPDDKPADYRPPANSGTNPPVSAGTKLSEPATDHPPQP